jgi:hypothetical protein
LEPSLTDEAGWTVKVGIRAGGSEQVIRFVVVLGVGYVLGAKAGRRRYEQIAGTYRAVAGHPAAKAALDAGRRKVAESVSPDPAMVKLTEIDSETSVLRPERTAD